MLYAIFKFLFLLFNSTSLQMSFRLCAFVYVCWQHVSCYFESSLLTLTLKSGYNPNPNSYPNPNPAMLDHCIQALQMTDSWAAIQHVWK